MMKTKKIILVIVIILIGLTAISASGIYLDLSTAYDLAFKSGFEFYADVKCNVFDNFALSIPVNFCCDDGAYLMNLGLNLIYYPWNEGFFVSFTICLFGFEINSNFLEDDLFSLNEITLGWNQKINEHWRAEIQFDVRNPSKTFEEEYEEIRTIFPNYRDLRIRLLIGWEF
ncbi:MAG: hypothetical protein PHD05_09100 [Sphaerochaetaceae bacterium]|nr:hypothetical protein [Sphaerochaetaceae bacterium]